MQIFYLHEDPAVCATMHCDEHVNKMTVESAQMLSHVYRMCMGTEVQASCLTTKRLRTYHLIPGDRLGKVFHKKTKSYRLGMQFSKIYGSTHKGHPCVKWLYESRENYIWLAKLGIKLCEEFLYRYKRDTHATLPVLYWLLYNVPPQLPNVPRTPVALAMPDSFKRDTPIESYRTFYREDKPFATWQRGREVPSWYERLC
jgi:hypothetical protein